MVQTVRPITERPGFECFRIAVNWSLANSDNSLPRARSCKWGSTKLSRDRAVVAAACSTTPRSMRPSTHQPRTDMARPTTAVAMMAKRIARSRESQNAVAARIVAAGTLRIGGETEKSTDCWCWAGLCSPITAPVWLSQRDRREPDGWRQYFEPGGGRRPKTRL